MARIAVVALLTVVAVAAAVVIAWRAGEAPPPHPGDPGPPPAVEWPLSDPALSVHTLVREDVFAGFLEDDLERLARGERAIDLLLHLRPAERPALLAWQGGATLYRAVRASEGGREGEFRGVYARALALFAEAERLGPDDPGVDAVTAGTHAVFADRLPPADRDAAWERAYAGYRRLWGRQADQVERLPPHLRGELLAGLAWSAQRTGRPEEAAEHRDRILRLLPGTPYEAAAKRWKEAPGADPGITCLTCHAAGRLPARPAAPGEPR